MGRRLEIIVGFVRMSYFLAKMALLFAYIKKCGNFAVGIQFVLENRVLLRTFLRYKTRSLRSYTATKFIILMKKLNFFLTMLLVAMVSVSFVSCENEQPEEKTEKEKTYAELIIGTWDMETVELYLTNGKAEQKVNLTAEEAGLDWTFVFTKDGELIWDQGDRTASGEYTIDGKKIMVEGEEFLTITKLTEKELSLSTSYTEGGADITETYNCVRVAE